MKTEIIKEYGEIEYYENLKGLKTEIKEMNDYTDSFLKKQGLNGLV